MIHVILTILKVLGIILLVLLLLVLLLLAVILFVPIRYTIKADYHEKPSADVRAWWLMHLLRFKAVYNENGLKYTLKLLWFTLMDSEAEEKTPEASKPSKHSKTAKQKKSAKDDDVFAESTDSNAVKNDDAFQSPKAQAEPEAGDGEGQRQENAAGQEPEADKDEDGKSGGQNNIFVRIRDFFVRLKDNIRNSYYKTAEFKNKAAAKIEEISDFVNDEENKEFIRFMKQQLGITLAHIAPLKYNINIRFGADSPDVTGKVTGLVAVVMTFLKTDKKTKRKGTFDYIPVFDEKALEADVFMSGRIRVCTLLLVVWRVYRNDKFKKLVLNK
ncbi:MAG: hypothetical protein ACI4EJ_10750 [Bacteroides sp.]